MPLKLTCPHCRSGVSLDEPFPLPGDAIKCTSCGEGLAVSYPDGAIETLQRRGKRFADESPAAAPKVPRAEAPRALAPRAPRLAAAQRVTSASAGAGLHGFTHAGTEVDYTSVDRTSVDATEIGEPENDFHEIDRTVPGMRSPYGELAGGAIPPEAQSIKDPFHTEATEAYDDFERSLDSDPSLAPGPKRRSASTLRRQAKGSAMTSRSLGCMGSVFGTIAAGTAAVGVLGLTVAGGAYWHYSQDLPTVEVLRAYQPPTVTVVTDTKGEILGEIFDQRRYVVPIDDIPHHVRDAFLAAEDANFYDHGGIDYIGIGRAIARNAAEGRMAQGASTITQQVARNFLLNRDKKIERKIKEAILSWRIEEAYEKDHILFLYLNEIFLGSQAYGVEAASRAYFNKGVADITIAEAAILAGLPQRPSDYSPHTHWSKAQARQGYVIHQMHKKGYITDAQAAEAVNEHVKIVPRGNAFLEQAPHFTEHVRRYLVDTYGEERVLRGGLQVRTTCDLDLQRTAQESVTKGVANVDQRMGFRRDGLEHLTSDAAIQEKRDAHESAMTKAWAYQQDAARRIEVPETSTLVAGETYEGVVLEVKQKWARVGIGSHEAILPIAWHGWVYDPNPKKSWRYRTATDLTMKVDADGDGTKESSILQKGDVVQVKAMNLDTQHDDVAKHFKNTPGASKSFVAGHLWQDFEIESALLSMDAHTGAVRAMVGGADFTTSQFNRAIQSRRQVGSTFKPIVYAAAVEAGKVTTSSMVADAALAFATSEEFVWKPGNYGDEYLGNITVRKALALSRNTCTVRVLEAMDPGMNKDVVYNFARRLGIGGTPLLSLEDGHIATPENDMLCPWTRETSKSTICMDRFPAKDPNISNTLHRKQMGPDDTYMCRACDMSMGLGSASLTMEELVRAYSGFASGGLLIDPYFIEEVKDRNGKVLETHEENAFPRVMEAEVASIGTWLLQGVVQGGTAHRAGSALELSGLAGKTGTTNDYKDAWFIGFTNDVITAAWVGFDQPRSMGYSSTGGRTALPIWIDYMRAAAPKEKDRPFPMRGDIEWAHIDEETGRRVSSGGRAYPFIGGTAPESTGYQAGQVSLEDLTTEL
jgi:penicillin-binding protein 1A